MINYEGYGMRYVIQHHTDAVEHYDLMIETEGSDSLITWKIDPKEMGLLRESVAVKAERINNHRKAYLDYEGQVSGDRGSVRIFDSGGSKTVLCDNNKFEFELSGKKFSGNLMFKEMGSGEFIVFYMPNMMHN